MERMLATAANATAASGHGSTCHPGNLACDPTQGGIFLFLALAAGVFSRTVLSVTGLPYTVILLIIGGLVGGLDLWMDLGSLSDSVGKWASMDPHLIMYIFLPGLIFGSAFSVDYHVFRKELWQMLLLAGPGMIISSVLTALVAIYLLPYNWGWFPGLAFGAMMSATDPVAVVALLRELGAKKRLSLLIEGESLFNDGTAMVVFTVFKDAISSGQISVGGSALTFGRLAIGGPVMGLLGGLLAYYVLKTIHFDHVSEITVTVVACYGVFIAAEGGLGFTVSGVLAVVVLGLTLSASARKVVTDNHSTHHFWEMVEYLANTLIFILSGVVIVERGLAKSITASDWGYLFLLYFFIHVIRLFTVFALLPMLRRMGYGFTVKEAFVLVYSGLRGAVGLALALLVAADKNIDPVMSQKFVFHMAGIAALTLLINGSTIGIVVEKLKITKATSASQHMFANALAHIKHNNEARMNDLKRDEFYSDADWHKVEEYLKQLHKSTATEEQRHDPAHLVKGAGRIVKRLARVASTAVMGRNGHNADAVQSVGVSRGLVSVAEGDEGGDSDYDSVIFDEGDVDSNLVALHNEDVVTVQTQEYTNRKFHACASIMGLHAVASARLEEQANAAAAAGGGRQRRGSNPYSGVLDGIAEDQRVASVLSLEESNATIELGHVEHGGAGAGAGAGSGIAHGAHAASSAAVKGSPAAARRRRGSTGSTHLVPMTSHFANDEELRRALVAEGRHRFLNLVKARIWHQYESGMLGQDGLSTLLDAAAFAQDYPDKVLREWEFLQPELKRASLPACVQRSSLSSVKSLARWFMFRPAMFEFDVATSFVRSHEEVEPVFTALVLNGTDEAKHVVDTVLGESRRSMQLARNRISQINAGLPEVMCAIKTHEVVRSLLKASQQMAHDLMHHGEIEEKEHDILADAIGEMYRRVRMPKHLDLPSTEDMLDSAGIFKDMNSDQRRALLACGNERVYRSGEVILEQGKPPAGFFIILQGTVSMRRRYPLGADDTCCEQADNPRVAADGYRHERSKPLRIEYLLGDGPRMVLDDTGANVNEAVLLQRLPKHAAVGVAAMLTGQPQFASIKCESDVDVIYFNETKIFKQLKSKQSADSIVLREVTALETNLCRAAAVALAHVALSHFRSMSLAEVATIMDEAVLLRPAKYKSLSLNQQQLLNELNESTHTLQTADDIPASSSRSNMSAFSRMDSEGAVGASNRDVLGPLVPTTRKAIVTGLPSQHHIGMVSNASVGTTATTVTVHHDSGDTAGEDEEYIHDHGAIQFLAAQPDQYRTFGPATRILALPPKFNNLLEGPPAQQLRHTASRVQKMLWASHIVRGSSGRRGSLASTPGKSNRVLPGGALSALYGSTRLGPSGPEPALPGEFVAFASRRRLADGSMRNRMLTVQKSVSLMRRNSGEHTPAASAARFNKKPPMMVKAGAASAGTPSKVRAREQGLSVPGTFNASTRSMQSASSVDGAAVAPSPAGGSAAKASARSTASAAAAAAAASAAPGIANPLDSPKPVLPPTAAAAVAEQPVNGSGRQLLPPLGTGGGSARSPGSNAVAGLSTPQMQINHA